MSFRLVALIFITYVSLMNEFIRPSGWGQGEYQNVSIYLQRPESVLDAPPTLSSLKLGLSWIRSLLIGQTVWQMRPRAPPVSLLPCWGHSHPPDFPVWPLRIRTRVLMLVPRPFTDWATSRLILKATFFFIVSQLFLKMLERIMKTTSSFLPKASFTFEYKTTDSLHSKGEGWLVVCMRSSR